MKRSLIAFAPVVALLALAACQDEPSVAETFNTLRGEVENKAEVLAAESENTVAAEERRLAAEANALFSQNANLLGNGAEVEVDVNSGDVAIDRPKE